MRTTIVFFVLAACRARGRRDVSYFRRPTVTAAFAKGAVLFAGADRNYMVHASRREQPGQAEVHVKDTDIIYVLDGSATFVTGGTVVDRQDTAPDEIRGRVDPGRRDPHARQGRRDHRPERHPALVQGSRRAVALLRRQGPIDEPTCAASLAGIARRAVCSPRSPGPRARYRAGRPVVRTPGRRRRSRARRGRAARQGPVALQRHEDRRGRLQGPART